MQNILLVVGASALGAVTCGMGLAILAALTILAPRPGQEPGANWGAAFGFMFCGIGGSAIGGIAGLVVAIRWIMQGRSEPWTPGTWIGVALGATSALAVRFSDVLNHFTFGHLIELWPGMALFLAAAATLGGLLGSIVVASVSSVRSAKRKPRGRRKPRRQDPD